MNASIVVMGVAGCGKSHVGSVLAEVEGWRLIEGDDFHSSESRRKMSQGIALTDTDREGWLAQLGELLAQSPMPVVLTCSALKRQYRDRLRAASPGLRFIFLRISREAAQSRVAARASHFFPPGLVDNQFATLEPPVDEVLTLPLDATQSIDELQRQISAWLRQETRA